MTVTKREIDLVIKNQDKVYDLVQKTFDEIKDLRKDNEATALLTADRVRDCHGRFVKLETRQKFKLRLYSSLAAATGTILGWLLQTFFSRLF